MLKSLCYFCELNQVPWIRLNLVYRLINYLRFYRGNARPCSLVVFEISDFKGEVKFCYDVTTYGLVISESIWLMSQLSFLLTDSEWFFGTSTPSRSNLLTIVAEMGNAPVAPGEL